ncbi:MULTISPECIES: hypothetical protein [unclassified Thioalkalivibrio]|uniref:hypothetical protein n=1 Tax=unclassified Thioalkalivibrio TaxID=2621013 RepID=UPI000363471A|nr:MULTISPECIES: hypothetical protein [unclassified Thioalkalivibrio]
MKYAIETVRPYHVGVTHFRDDQALDDPIQESDIGKLIFSDGPTFTLESDEDRSIRLAHAATERMERLSEEIRAIAEAMPHRGDTCEESQRMCLLWAALDLERVINGLSMDDFSPAPDSADGWTPYKLAGVLEAGGHE